MKSFLPCVAGIIVILIIFPVFTYGDDVFAVLSGNIKPYNECFDGLKSNVSGSIVQEYLPEDLSQIDNLIKKIKDNSPKVLVLIGTKAFDVVSPKITEIPIVFTMVLNPSIKPSQKNITGLTMNVDLEVRINFIQKVLPNAKKVGLIITPDIKKNYSEKIKKAEANSTYQFTKLEVETASELFKRLKEFEGTADCILLFPDQILLEENNFSVILMFSFKNNIPLIGVSPKYIKMGALYGLYSDYKSTGKETGKIVKRILSGNSPSSIPVEDLKDPDLILNRRISKKMNVTLSEDIINSAKQVFD
ncbi:MAG: ABC transporter substrate binding protein [bacterium]|nr:ABC transporter substrate binding protein [bacterium]